MEEKSFWREGLERYLLDRGLYSKKQMDMAADKELYNLYDKYVKDNNIEKEAREYLDYWYFTNR